MNNINRNQLVELKNILQNYRQNDLGFRIDETHILKWLSQFDESSRDVVLQETLHVFRNYYFTNEDVHQFVENIVLYLTKEVEKNSVKDIFENYIFVHIQRKGNSQNNILNILKEIANKENMVVLTSVCCEKHNYVYIDDGIYSGNRAIEDLTNLLNKIPNNSTVYVFHFLSTSLGLEKTRVALKTCAKEKSITILFFAWKKLYNYREPQITTTYTAWDTEEYYPNMCLWPERTVLSNEIVGNFINMVRDKFPNQNFEYRCYPWSEHAGIFSSVENRRRIEEIFLIKGIYIYQFCDKRKKQYPLGGESLRTFGTGTFCAFQDNISNTCPLVLWWGNTDYKGNPMDNWYPLLPRRINEQEESAF